MAEQSDQRGSGEPTSNPYALQGLAGHDEDFDLHLWEQWEIISHSILSTRITEDNNSFCAENRWRKPRPCRELS